MAESFLVQDVISSWRSPAIGLETGGSETEGVNMHERISRILNGSGVYYAELRQADLGTHIVSPIDSASRITKTLLLRSTDRLAGCLVVLPCNRTLNLQVVADRLKVNRVEIANDQDLSEELRYPPSEASPLGAGEMAVLVDESLLGMSTIIIGGGEAGVAIEIAPVGLCMLTDATVLCLVDELE